MTATQQSPHAGQPVQIAGEPLSSAQAAMIMIHGRGASAADILSLAPLLNTPGFAYLAPEASGNSWYPYSFLSPLDNNEPGLSSALSVIDGLVDHVLAAGIPAERIMILGFSQGACLATEYAARYPRRFGGIAGLSGGLIGPDDAPRDYPGTLEGTPVFLGCSDVDPHIPAARVTESAAILEQMGAQVTRRLYPNMGHLVNEDEIEHVRAMMAVLVPARS